MRAKLKACEADKGEYLSGWQRAKADSVNARREEERRKDVIKFSEKALVLELVNLADSFDGLDSPTRKAGKNREKLAARNGAFAFSTDEYNEKPGVEAMKTWGKYLTPQESESIGEMDVDTEEKDGIVMEEARKGYKMHGMVIRPSLVKVGGSFPNRFYF